MEYERKIQYLFGYVVIKSNYEPVVDLVSNYFGDSEKTVKIGDELCTTIFCKVDKNIVFDLCEHGKTIITENDHILRYNEIEKMGYNASEPANLFWKENEVWIQTRTLRAAFINTYKLARKIIISNLAHNNGSFIHSSAVSINQNGVLFLGKKGNGKTSFLLQTLKRYEKSKYIANDCSILIENDKKMYINFFPGNIRVGVGTLKNEFDSRVLTSVLGIENNPAYYLYHRCLDEGFIREIYEDKNIEDKEDKINLNTYEINKITQRKSTPCAELKVVILVNLDFNQKSKLYKISSPEEKYRILKQRLEEIERVPFWLKDYIEGNSISEVLIKKLCALDVYEFYGNDLLLPNDVVS